MIVHVDTSFLIRALTSGSAEDRRLRHWLREGAVLAVSAICWAEFLCGPVHEEALELATRLLGQPLPFEAADAAMAAQLFNLAGRRRGSLTDCMVAATAVGAGARLATSNAADFHRFQPAGLEVITA